MTGGVVALNKSFDGSLSLLKGVPIESGKVGARVGVTVKTGGGGFPLAPTLHRWGRVDYVYFVGVALRPRPK